VLQGLAKWEINNLLDQLNGRGTWRHVVNNINLERAHLLRSTCKPPVLRIVSEAVGDEIKDDQHLFHYEG
jgi:hypothetical protein